jgi:aryl-alcohol dehydrogenase-like predicted oxidoreductase
MAQIALAWVRQKPGVTSPIIGASRPEQLAELVGGLDLMLSAKDIAAVEAHYVPHALLGQE